MMYHRVYDRCQYRNCRNGKHKGDHLFRFPKKRSDQKVWIKNSGNILLAHWTTSSRRTAGICKLHFKDEDFTTAEKIRLRRNRVPIHWNTITDVSVSEIPDETEEPVMEDAVVDSPAVFDQCMEEDIENNEERVIESTVVDLPTDYEEHLEVTTDVSDVTYSSGQNLLCRFEEFVSEETHLHQEFSRKINETGSNDCNTTDKSNGFCETISSNNRCNTYCCQLYNFSLLRKIKALENKVETLKHDLRNEKRISNRLRIKLNAEKSSNITEIDTLSKNYPQLTPLSGAMIKLQFRERKTYTEDEKELAKIIYYHSATLYTQLRKKKLFLPDESTVRAWVSEYEV